MSAEPHATSFTPLAEIMRAVRAPAPPALEVPLAQAAVPQPVAADDSRELAFARFACAQLALARLAAVEAYERAAARLIEALARDVLGRELALAPADVAALASHMLAALETDVAVTVALAPCDAERMQATIPVRADPTLSAGDVIVEVCDGIVDARIDVRLRAAVEGAFV